MLEIRDQRLILCVGPLDTSQSSHQHMSVLYPRSGKSYPESTPTVTALLELSDTRTFERYLVVLALVVELTTVAMSKVTDRLAVWDEKSRLIRFAAHCRWYRAEKSQNRNWRQPSHRPLTHPPSPPSSPSSFPSPLSSLPPPCPSVVKPLRSAMADRAAGAVQRRERRQRSWWRHEQLSVAAAVATVLHQRTAPKACGGGGKRVGGGRAAQHATAPGDSTHGDTAGAVARRSGGRRGARACGLPALLLLSRVVDVQESLRERQEREEAEWKEIRTEVRKAAKKTEREEQIAQVWEHELEQAVPELLELLRSASGGSSSSSACPRTSKRKRKKRRRTSARPRPCTCSWRQSCSRKSQCSGAPSGRERARAAGSGTGY